LVQVGLLGPLRVVGDDGVEVGLAAPKERAVMELLALRAGLGVPAWELIDALWGEDPPRSAAKTLHEYVSSWRRLLPAGTIETVGSGCWLAMAAEGVDALCFEQMVRQCGQALGQGDLTGAVEALGAGLRLWRGEPRVELAGQPIGMAEAVRLGELRRDGEEQLAEARLASGEPRSLVADLEAAVTAEPLRQGRWAQLMRAFYRAGRQADALRAFQRLRTVLGDELGAELRILEAVSLAQNASWTGRPRPSRISVRLGSARRAARAVPRR
jgi:DNA-binding SARP family transcriptional activator